MVVKDRVWADGELIESTHDYFAQDDAGTVHYFGERVDNLRDGRVVNHDGSWLYGRDTDVIGVLMPAQPQKRRPLALRGRAADQVEHDRMVDRIASVQVRGKRYRPRDRRARVRAARQGGRAQALRARRRRDRRAAARGEVGLVRCERAPKRSEEAGEDVLGAADVGAR